jgi:SAM-dependent methyltransferase
MRIGDDGILVVDEQRDDVLVVSFDGDYVWSLQPSRDGRPSGAGLLVAWPDALRPFLHGAARVQVADVVGAGIRYDDEVRLGSGDGRIRIVDGHYHPLCVDKVGHLTRSFGATHDGVREEVLRGTARALGDLRDVAGVEAYLNYGALLGAIRDGAMIAHDSDTDLCYLSPHESPADIIRESYRVERVMRDRGWDVLRMSGGDIKLLLPLTDGRVCHVDVFAAFRVGETFFQLGNRSGHLDRSAIVPVSTVELGGQRFAAPADPEAMLAFVYGPGWRVPDPSFRYADPPAGVRRLDGWLRGFRTDMPRWAAHHQADGVRAGSSEFAREVVAGLPEGARVADLGSGSGRDALLFARHGHAVRAYDFARPAVQKVRRQARRQGLGVAAYRLILDEFRFVAATGALLAREPHELYSRQLLGCLTPAAREHLWRLARMALSGGGALHLEYAATGRRLAAPEPAGLVRRLDPDEIRREIERSGGVIEEERLLASDEDPQVCRLRVRWPRDTTTVSRSLEESLVRVP